MTDSVDELIGVGPAQAIEDTGIYSKYEPNLVPNPVIWGPKSVIWRLNKNPP